MMKRVLLNHFKTLECKVHTNTKQELLQLCKSVYHFQHHGQTLTFPLKTQWHHLKPKLYKKHFKLHL